MSPPFYPPSHLPQARLSLSTEFELPASYSKFPPAVYSTYGRVYVSMLFSRSVPPSPSRAVSTSLFSMSASPYAQSLQSCPTHCNPMDHGLPGSSVHEILQTRILEWVAISFSSYISIAALQMGSPVSSFQIPDICINIQKFSLSDLLHSV